MALTVASGVVSWAAALRRLVQGVLRNAVHIGYAQSLSVTQVLHATSAQAQITDNGTTSYLRGEPRMKKQKLEANAPTAQMVGAAAAVCFSSQLESLRCASCFPRSHMCKPASQQVVELKEPTLLSCMKSAFVCAGASNSLVC